MATEVEAVPQNVSGAYFVDFSCIYCSLCVETAPMIFEKWESEGWAYVTKQPTNPEEIALAEELINQCPLDSIGRYSGPD